MAQLPEQVFGRWVHSHEEDEGDCLVYRRPEHPLPRSRGRDGIELHPDGTAIHHAIAAADGNDRIEATWEASGPSEVRIDFPSGRPSFVLALVRADEDRLVVTRRPG